MSSDVTVVESKTEKKPFTWKAGLLVVSAAGISILGGFGMTLAMAKKQDPKMFAKGLSASREIHESGISLASRALAKATLYTLTGFSLVCFSVWKLMGVKDMNEFRQKAGSVLPRIPKKENPGRSEFKNLTELFEYIIQEDEKEKLEKKEQSKT